MQNAYPNFEEYPPVSSEPNSRANSSSRELLNTQRSPAASNAHEKYTRYNVCGCGFINYIPYRDYMNSLGRNNSHSVQDQYGVED